MSQFRRKIAIYINIKYRFIGRVAADNIEKKTLLLDKAPKEKAEFQFEIAYGTNLVR